MPWKTITPMEEIARFVLLARRRYGAAARGQA